MRLNFGILKRQKSPIPGFGLTMGYIVFYLSIIVMIPPTALFSEAFSMGFDAFIKTTTDTRVIASYKLTFITSLIAALVNTFFGLIVAWCLVRYTFFGKRVFDAIVDLPFALPTAVSGIALTTLFQVALNIVQTNLDLNIKL